MKMHVKTANEEKKINNVIGYIQGSSEPGTSEDSKAKSNVTNVQEFLPGTSMNSPLQISSKAREIFTCVNDVI